MLSVHVDNVEDVAVVQVEGRIVHSDAAYTLRNAVTLRCAMPSHCKQTHAPLYSISPGCKR